MGTTTLAILVAVAAPLGMLIHRGLSEGATGITAHLRGDVRFTAAIIAGAWALIYAYSVAETIYMDHQQLVASNLKHLQEGGDWRFKYGNLKVIADARGNENQELRSKLQIDEVVIQAFGNNNPAPARPSAKRPPVAAAPAIGTLGKYVCTTTVTAQTSGHYAQIIEFGIQHSETSGFAGVVGIDQPITKTAHWESLPLRTDIPPGGGAIYTNVNEQTTGNIYRLSFATPNISSSHSEYFYIESDKPFAIRGILFLENFDVIADQLKANQMAAVYSTCPR